MGETLDKFLQPAFTPHYVFFCLLSIICCILSKPDGDVLLGRLIRPLWLPCLRAISKLVKFINRLKKKLTAQPPAWMIGHPQSLYRLPVEVRLELFKEVYAGDNGNAAMRSLLWALRGDPALLEEANEIYYPGKNFQLTKKNQWSLLNYPSTRVEDLELVKHITIDLRYC
jgi:hypothetical protein